MPAIRRRAILLLTLAIVLGSTLHASTLVQKMDMPEVCSRADKIFRGTVVSATPGSIEAGGATLPTITYRMTVTEAFQGNYITKGDQSMAEITMLGRMKGVEVDGVRSMPLLQDMPVLDVGGDYLLMTSRPSAAGLSAPIGLAQGCYAISGKGEGLTAVNGVGESYDYNEMAGAIRAALEQ